MMERNLCQAGEEDKASEDDVTSDLVEIPVVEVDAEALLLLAPHARTVHHHICHKLSLSAESWSLGNNLIVYGSKQIA